MNVDPVLSSIFLVTDLQSSPPPLDIFLAWKSGCFLHKNAFWNKGLLVHIKINLGKNGILSEDWIWQNIHLSYSKVFQIMLS